MLRRDQTESTPSILPCVLCAIVGPMGAQDHWEPGSGSLPLTSVLGECPLTLSAIPFCQEVVGGWREEVESRGSLKWAGGSPTWPQWHSLGPPPLQLPYPVQLLIHLQGPLGLKQAETVGANISDYIVNIRYGAMKPPNKCDTIFHFQSFGFQPPFRTALCTTLMNC